ncbi:MAG TPA: SgcJ/EcaC family oxidoreductase [Caulobacteraceae bacterium]|nr:SgcJ/EcaC family oxidoreductase [Caulobacteraceae bacterium]
MDTIDRAGVEELERQFHQAVAEKDVGKIISMYAEDAAILPPGGLPIEGRAAIEAFWRASVDAAAGVKLVTEDVRLLGPGVAQERGRILMGGPPGEGPATKFLIIWRKIKDRWVLQTDMWNTDG